MIKIDPILARLATPGQWLTPVAIAFAVIQAWIASSALADGLLGVTVGSFVVAAWLLALLALVQPRWPWARAVAAGLLATLSVLSISQLFLASAWRQDFGGFPAIGDGSLFLKQVSVAGLAAWIGFTALRRDHAARTSLAVARMGVVTVLLVIGGAKFVSYEAELVDTLLAGSPVLGWMRWLGDVRAVSTYIGVIEILLGLGILGWPYRRRSGMLALVMCAGMLLGTTSFLFSLPGWSAQAGAPWLGAEGIFLVTDLLLLMSCVMSLCLESPSIADDGSSGNRRPPFLPSVARSQGRT